MVDLHSVLLLTLITSDIIIIIITMINIIIITISIMSALQLFECNSCCIAIAVVEQRLFISANGFLCSHIF